MYPASGDAMIFSAAPREIVIFVRQRREAVIDFDPAPGISWQDFTEKYARPALVAAGWSLNGWHRPRGNDEIIATTFAWRT